ncbi:MAG: hypothetical protein ACE361_15170 [Aureliella sp.]
MQNYVHWQLFRRDASSRSDKGSATQQTGEACTNALSTGTPPAPLDSSAVFACTFESVVDQLAKLPGMFIEMDGSFVIRQPAENNGHWQMDGMIYDRGVEVSPNGNRESRVHWCDIQGSFSKDIWDQVWSCFETPLEELLIYDVSRQTYLAPAELFSN